MKGKSIFKTILITILVVVLCTWIFPTASFQTTLIEGERAQAGLFDLFSYPMVALTYFAYVVLYVAVIGIFYGVMNKIPAYHTLIEKIQNYFKGKENIFLVTVMVLISILVSVTGLSFGMIFIFPLIISIILAMGYNKLVAASATVGSTICGLAGTTLGSSTVSYMNQILGTEIMNEMVSKVVILVAFVIVLVANVLFYAKKTKSSVVEAKKDDSSKKANKVEDVVEVVEETEKEATKKQSSKKATSKTTSGKKSASKTSTTKKTSDKKAATKKATSSKTKSTKTRASMAKTEDVIKVKNTKEKKVRIWPLVVIFDLVLIIACISVFDWSGVLKIDWFTEATTAVLEFEVLGFPIFSKLLGTVNEFGLWSLNIELPALIMMATLVIALIYRVKWNDLVEGIFEGLKKAIIPACLMLLAYVVLVITTYHPFQLVFTKFLLDLTSGLNVVTMSIIAMLASVFNVETAYTAQSTLPYVMSVITDSSLYPLLGVIFQGIYGLMMLVAPTSVILIGTLSYLDISYGQWLKHIWKVFVELLVVLLIIFLIILAI